MNKRTVTFETSAEGVPVICVTRESTSLFGSSCEIMKVITGNEAQSIWKKLTDQNEVQR